MPASIFNSTTQGAAVKLLKNILRFKNDQQIVNGYTEAQILAGVPSPEWSFAIPTDSDNFLIKYGSLDTEWKYLSDFIVEDLGDISTDPHGFVTPQGKIDFDFDDASRTLTLTPTGTNYTYYNNGVKKVVSTPQSKQITDIEGTWFWFFDETGVLDCSQDSSDMFNTIHVFVAVARWNSTAGEFIYHAKEYHSTLWPSDVWKYHHTRFGTAFISGFSPGNIVADGDGSNDDQAQISLSDGVFRDEDLLFEIANNTPQAMDPLLNAPIYYLLNASDWRKNPASNFVCMTTGTGRAAYNLFSGGNWSLQEATNNYFICMHLYETNDDNYPGAWILGQNQYATGAAALAAAQTELANLILGGMPTVEWTPIATFVIQTNDTYTNSVKSRIRSDGSGVEFIDWRGSKITPTTSPTNHNTLTNLTVGDAHTQYYNVNGRNSNLSLYIGDSSTNGSWRLRTDQAGSFYIEERVAGVWQERMALP